MSVGTISQLEQATTAVVAAPVEEARDVRRMRKKWRTSMRPAGVKGANGPGYGWR